MVWVNLGLDVESHTRVARFAHQREQLAQGRDARPRHGTLVGELFRIGAVRPDLADVIGPDLVQPQFNQGRAGRSDVCAVGAACEIRIEPALVRNHDLAVCGHADVELQRVHAHRQRVGEGRQSVLRQQRPAAAMRLEIESHGLPRYQDRQHSQNCRGT